MAWSDWVTESTDTGSWSEYKLIRTLKYDRGSICVYKASRTIIVGGYRQKVKEQLVLKPITVPGVPDPIGYYPADPWIEIGAIEKDPREVRILFEEREISVPICEGECEETLDASFPK